VQEPLWETKDDYYAIRGLAERFGYSDRFPETKRDMLRRLAGRDDDIDFDTLFEQGTQKKESVPIVKYTDEFPTETGRIKMYDDDAPSEEGVTFDVPRPLEDRTADDYEKADEYPLMFMQKHSRFRIHSQYEMLNWVREINPEPQLDIHPKDAKARDIDDGEYVRVYNDRGEMVVKAKYNDAFQPGLVTPIRGGGAATSSRVTSRTSRTTRSARSARRWRSTTCGWRSNPLPTISTRTSTNLTIRAGLAPKPRAPGGD